MLDALASASVSPPASTLREACSVAWVRPIGIGAVRRDFGHSVATNASGEVLIAARLERLDLGTTGEHEASSGGKLPVEVLVDALGALWALPAEAGALLAPRGARAARSGGHSAVARRGWCAICWRLSLHRRLDSGHFCSMPEAT